MNAWAVSTLRTGDLGRYRVRRLHRRGPLGTRPRGPGVESGSDQGPKRSAHLATRPHPCPQASPGSPGRDDGAPSGRCARAVVPHRTAKRRHGEDRRGSPADCALRRSNSARPTSSSARSWRRATGSFPRARGGVQVVSGPGATRALARHRTGDLRGTRPADTRGLCVHRPRSACCGIDRPGPSCATSRRDRSGDQGAATHCRPAGPPGSRRYGVAGSAPDRTHSHRRARQPAGPGRALRRDDRRGARLPPRGGEHDRHRRRPSPSSASATSSFRGPTPRW